jgi:hypothetical protein
MQQQLLPLLAAAGGAAVALSGASATPVVDTVNLSLYRVTPQEITGGIANLNTGDAAGDTYFALYEIMFPLYCREMPEDSSCNVSDQGVLNVPNNNVYERSTAIVDPRYGAYAGCMPPPSDPSSPNFVCHPYVNESACWWQQQNPDGRSFDDGPGSLASVCIRGSCNCSAVDGTPVEGKVGPVAVGSYLRPMGQLHTHWHKETPMWVQIQRLEAILNGTWFSTRKEGECPRGQLPGDGRCFWAFAGVNRRVNATCVNNRLKQAVVNHHPTCFSSLPQPANSSRIDWIGCMLASLTGTAFEAAKAPKAGAMTREQVVGTFESAFLPSDAGGCPTVRVSPTPPPPK